MGGKKPFGVVEKGAGSWFFVATVLHPQSLGARQTGTIKIGNRKQVEPP